MTIKLHTDDERAVWREAYAGALAGYNLRRTLSEPAVVAEHAADDAVEAFRERNATGSLNPYVEIRRQKGKVAKLVTFVLWIREGGDSITAGSRERAEASALLRLLSEEPRP